MPSMDQMVDRLDYLFQQLISFKAANERLAPMEYSDAPEFEKQTQKNRDGIRDTYQDIRRALREFETFPDRHVDRFRELDFEYRDAKRNSDFYRQGSLYRPDVKEMDPLRWHFERSVFIMTKFPDPEDENAKELEAVIRAVEKAVSAKGYCPRIATEKPHNEWLWGNVATYLLGCSRGIAIVEDVYRKELNPNVAMEWGWMRGMGREVLFLREKGFSNDRANWDGLISFEFDWKNPAESIPARINNFLPALE